MERSSRFLSLSGWSGVWAGGVALVAAFIAHSSVASLIIQYNLGSGHIILTYTDELFLHLIFLAFGTLLVAALGSFFFTLRKSRRMGYSVWGSASKKLFISMLMPLMAGGLFCIAFILNGDVFYLAPTCLAFYGMALVNGGKYTLGEIRYLGYSELLLGCICLFFPGYGLYFWAAGFGLLHIIYGLIMWNRYDRNEKELN